MHRVRTVTDIPDWKLPQGVPRSLWEYAHDDGIARTDERFLAGEQLLRFDQRLLDDWYPQPLRVVDLGCGTGRTLRALAARGCEVLGVDLSPPSLAVARETLSQDAQSGGRVALLRGNLCDLSCLPDGQFDLALLMFGTLGMVSGDGARRSVLREARRLLRPDGELVLHVHNRWRHLAHPQGRSWLIHDAWRWLRRAPDRGDTRHDYRGIPGVLHHVFSRGEILSLLAESGFDVLADIPVDLSGDRAATGPRWRTNLSATGWIVRGRRGVGGD